jgi:hypothetical protein
LKTLAFFTFALLLVGGKPAATAQPALGPYTIGARLASLQAHIVADETPAEGRTSGIKRLRLRVPEGGIAWQGIAFHNCWALVEADTLAALVLERNTEDPRADLDPLPEAYTRELGSERGLFRATAHVQGWAVRMEGTPSVNVEMDTDPTAELLGEDNPEATPQAGTLGTLTLTFQTRERDLLNQSVALDCGNIRFNPASVQGVWRVESVNTELSDFERFAQFSFEPTGVVMYTSGNRAVQHTFRARFTGSAMRLIGRDTNLVLDFCASFQGAKLVLEANYGAERYVLIR